MGLQIVYGKAGSGKSKYCFSEIANLIKSEKKIFVITPEQFSFTAEKKLLDAVDTQAVLNAEVITLSRMAHRVINEIGYNKKVDLSKAGRAMLIYYLLDKFKKELKFLGKSDDNIDVVSNALTEFKKHEITVEKLKEEKENIEDKYLQLKLEDLYKIYENYEEIIQNNYIDNNDLLAILAEKIEEVDLVKNSIIYIDEFAGFTAQEYEVLVKLIKIAKKVTITICSDNLDLNTNPDCDIFYSNKQTISRLIDIVKNNGLQMEKPIKLENLYRYKNIELKHLEENIYNNKSTKYGKTVENIELFLAKNQYSEVEKVAREIAKEVRENNLRYSDISVITKNINTYSSLIRVIFEKHGIPVFIDEQRDLAQNIIVQYFLSILEILNKNFTNESIFNYLKINLHDIDQNDIFELENYSKKWGIKNNKWKKKFDYGIEENKEQTEKMEIIREKIINPFEELKKDIKECENTKEMSLKIYEFLENQKLRERINQKIKQLEEMELFDLGKEYKTSYNIIIEILEQIVLIFGEEKLSIDKYIQIFKVGLKNSGLTKIPGTQDQVIVGDVDRSRSHKVKDIFIIGINDGVFPSVNKDEGFLNDTDREFLKNDGIELAKGTIDRLYEDNFNIYKTFTTAEEKLFLSYASADNEGKSLRQSILINKIKKIFPNIEEKSDLIQKQYTIENKEVTYEQLLSKIADIKNGAEFDDVWKELYSYYAKQDEWKERLDKDLKGIVYTNLPSDISKDKIEKLYGNTLVTSVSKLERYQACAFSYYLQYGLRIKENDELKIQSFNTGSLMHEIIDEFFEHVKLQKIELPSLINEDEKIQEIVNKIINEKLKLSKNYIFTATEKYKALVIRLKRIVAKALKYIIEGIVYSDFNIEGTEIEFGKNKKYDSINIWLDNGKQVEITGKIDRVDVARTDDGNYLRIIDYKSSAKDIDLNEVYAGLQIQLLTYLDATCKQEDLMPAGVLYFGLLEQMIKADKKIEQEEIEEQIRKNFRMKGLILADVKVIKMNDNTLTSGSSKIIPAALTQDGQINKRSTKGVNSEEFKILQEYIYKTIKNISKEILAGKIDLKPYNRNGKTPCEYCSYKSICGFDLKNKGNKYNYIPNKTNDDIILKMKEEK